ncbi:MAG: class I SAM-dependent RNA methyltransferase [Alphaproteobacteria bacterium]|nr:MAG: class I SAM-dependent RNA methyltransferase [Alphaproteobacteria bacterium]
MAQSKRNRRNRSAGRKPKKVVTGEAEVEITELGDQGDGIALMDETRVFVAGALPGEILRIQRTGNRGEILRILQASPDRQAARCPHDSQCGGCTLQRLGPEGEARFKLDLLAKALARERLTAAITHPMFTVPERARRRASFALWQEGDGIAFGFQGRRSHDVVKLEECVVIRSEIMEAMPALSKALGPIVRRQKGLKLEVTCYPRGLDINLVGAKLDPLDLDIDEMNSLAATVAVSGVLRLSLEGVLYLEPRAPSLTFGGVNVAPPPGAFLQATEESEVAMQSRVLRALRARNVKGPVADLFCGCGTFTLPIAQYCEVVGFDAQEDQIDSLRTAVQRAAQNRVQVERRDLYRRPLVEQELNKFGAVVLDPPRAGAKDQIARLAASEVDLVIYVSCDHKTFSRDGRTLQEAGFELTELTPVDQFRYAAHLECVGIFERNRKA